MLLSLNGTGIYSCQHENLETVFFVRIRNALILLKIMLSILDVYWKHTNMLRLLTYYKISLQINT